MKTIKQLFITAVFSASVLVTNASELRTTTSFYSEDSEMELSIENWMIGMESEFAETKSSESTVVDIAVSNPDFSILVEAVSKAGLVDALNAEGPFTVFAPTNKAFKSLFSQLGVNGVEDLNVDQLMPILMYHVVSGKVLSTDLSDGEVATLNKERKLKVNISNGVKINESNVVAADIEGKNGVIHVIDKVLLPK